MDDMFLPPKRRPPTSGLPPVSHNQPPEPKPEPVETINLADDLVVTPPVEPVEDSEKPANDEPPLKKKFHITKKQWLITAAALVLLLVAGGTVYWFVLKPAAKPKPASNSVPVAAANSTPAAIVSPLSGEAVSNQSLANRPVTGLMIENSLSARPQSGLIDAGVVFEAVAEGGITRFLALYQESQPQYIGPIRSARPYFIDFDLGFDAGLGHVGGSPDALNDIKSLGVKNLDEFSNGGAYWRISSRPAPHNMYTSFTKLDALNQSKGYTSSHFTAFVRKKDVPQTPTASSIDFTISGSNYNVHYQYVAATNTYNRSEGGSAHTDQQTGTQISPKVVIALVMNESLAPDGDHTVYQDVGSGQMYVFQDGIVSNGTWSKAGRSAQFVFTDKNGLPMKLNAGQTWISIVGSASDVSYTP